MLTATRVAAMVAVLALGTWFLAVQVGSPPETGGPAAAPAATDEDEGVAATYVTGTSSGNRTVHRATYTVGEAYAHNTGHGGVYERDIAWSDPRLPSLMRLAENWDFYAVGGSEEINGAISIMSNVLLTGPDGAWTGTAYGLLEETKPVETYPQTVVMMLEGEGAYEGLSAMLTTTYDEPPAGGTIPDWEGYIFEGELAPMPEAPEPPSE